MDIESQQIQLQSQSIAISTKSFSSKYQMLPQAVTYHLPSSTQLISHKQYLKKKKKAQSEKQQSDSQLNNESCLNSVMDDHMSMTSSRYSITLKSNQNGGYYQQLQKIKKFKGKNKNYFEQVIVGDIMKSEHVPKQRKEEVIELYRALCVFSSVNVLFYKRLYKHELQFSLFHGDEEKNKYEAPEQMLPRLKQLMQGHLKVGAGIQNIRSFYHNSQIVKDQYSTLLHSLLRVVFSKVRDFIILRHPKLSYLLNTIKPGTARFNYSNAVSISLLHAEKQFSPSMNTCFQKIVKVVYFYDGVQDIKLSDVEALFELLRQRNQQHLVPIRLEEMKKPRMPGKKLNPSWAGFIPYVPYSEPQCDADFQVEKPSGDQIFQKCQPYTTRNWSLKFERYVLALYMKHQNFLDLKESINSEYQYFLGREFDLDELRVKFDVTMKKLIIYLQLELYYIIRRTNVSKMQSYKVNFSTKKFLSFNKNQKRALFSSQNAKNCRMFIIDYYLNNFDRRSKSYKMSLINYRLSYISMTSDAIMAFLSTKVGQCGILIESQLQKEDTYPLKLISNAYFSILKSILKQILIQKSIKTHDQSEKMVKNPNTKRSIYNATQIDKVFDELRPDDLMEIQNLYLIRRNKSLIVKRNPKMFPNFKLTKTLQEGLVEEEWDSLMMIMDRRGKKDDVQDQDGNNRQEKFQTGQGFDIEDEDALNMEKFKKGPRSSTSSQSNGIPKLQASEKRNTSAYRLSSSYQIKPTSQQRSSRKDQLNKKTVYETQTEQIRKKNKAQFMKALKQSQFLKTQLLILKVNEEKNGFKKYYK